MAAIDEVLNERERQVLQALIDAHIGGGEPIGSKALAGLSHLGVSPATIRSVLGVLHDRGLIAQPHTSAGRIPTDRGLRYYVDSLLLYTPPAPELEDQIAARVESAAGVDQAMREASRALSRVVKHTCVLLADPARSSAVRHVELVRLRDDAVLFIVVTSDGRVQNRLLEWRGMGVAPAQTGLDRIADRLSSLLEGHTLDEGAALIDAEIARAKAELQAEEERLLAMSRQGVVALSPEPGVHLDGAAHLIAPAADARAVQRSRELVALLEETERVRDLFANVGAAPGIRIFIGNENPDAALADVSMITARVGSPGRPLGVLGVIGPRHLDYGRVVPLVDVTARVLGRLSAGA